MTVNTTPIFTKSGSVQWPAAALSAANTARDGTGTVATVFTAGADGAFAQKLVARSNGNNAATVLRVFINNGGDNAVAANNSMINEMTMPATTTTEVAAQPPYELPLNVVLPPGYRLMCTLGTAVAAGYQLTAFGGSYSV